MFCAIGWILAFGLAAYCGCLFLDGRRHERRADEYGVRLSTITHTCREIIGDDADFGAILAVESLAGVCGKRFRDNSDLRRDNDRRLYEINLLKQEAERLKGVIQEQNTDLTGLRTKVDSMSSEIIRWRKWWNEPIHSDFEWSPFVNEQAEDCVNEDFDDEPAIASDAENA